MQTSDYNEYQYPAFCIKHRGFVCAVVIFPRLYSKNVGYRIPPIVEERIDSICDLFGHTSDDVLLVALNRQLETGMWEGVINAARHQEKIVIAVATDCAERAERAVNQMRMELKSACKPLTKGDEKQIA